VLDVELVLEVLPLVELVEDVDVVELVVVVADVDPESLLPPPPLPAATAPITI